MAESKFPVIPLMTLFKRKKKESAPKDEKSGVGGWGGGEVTIGDSKHTYNLTYSRANSRDSNQHIHID